MNAVMRPFRTFQPPRGPPPSTEAGRPENSPAGGFSTLNRVAMELSGADALDAAVCVLAGFDRETDDGYPISLVCGVLAGICCSARRTPADGDVEGENLWVSAEITRVGTRGEYRR